MSKKNIFERVEQKYRLDDNQKTRGHLPGCWKFWYGAESRQRFQSVVFMRNS